MSFYTLGSSKVLSNVPQSVQINNAGSIMSQRDVNAEGLEKSFALNVLGESKNKEDVRGKC